MSDQPNQNAQKDPSDWVTGDEPATGPQLSYLQTLAREAGQELPENLTKAEASQKIDELRSKSARTSDQAEGRSADSPGADSTDSDRS